jgi:hypothetical protein
MGLLFAFLENENRDDTAATPATPATPALESSGSSRNSGNRIEEPRADPLFRVAEVAGVAAHDFENRKSPDLAPADPAEPPEVAVARRLDAMAAENARWRDWWRASPYEPNGSFVMRSAATGESVTIHLPRGSAGR